MLKLSQIQCQFQYRIHTRINKLFKAKYLQNCQQKIFDPTQGYPIDDRLIQLNYNSNSIFTESRNFLGLFQVFFINVTGYIETWGESFFFYQNTIFFKLFLHAFCFLLFTVLTLLMYFLCINILLCINMILRKRKIIFQPTLITLGSFVDNDYGKLAYIFIYFLYL